MRTDLTKQYDLMQQALGRIREALNNSCFTPTTIGKKLYYILDEYEANKNKLTEQYERHPWGAAGK